MNELHPLAQAEFLGAGAGFGHEDATQVHPVPVS